jgi:hypothetical protein
MLLPELSPLAEYVIEILNFDLVEFQPRGMMRTKSCKSLSGFSLDSVKD